MHFAGYRPLIPSIDKPFERLSESEARNYFNRYVDTIDERIAYLRSWSKLNLDFSEQSLIDVWEWFLRKAAIVKTSRKDRERVIEQLSDKPSDFIAHVLQAKEQTLSIESEYLIRDIAMYLGALFVQNCRPIHWTYFTEEDKAGSFVNQPVLYGFIEKDSVPIYMPVFEPNHMVRVRAFRIVRNKAKSTDLYDLYKIWIKKVPVSSER